jgi:hypothetical protein
MSQSQFGFILSAILQIVQLGWKFSLQDYRDFGVVSAVALRFGLFEAKGVVDEVREHFIRGDGGLDQAMAFKDSYTPTFNMVGVAGAILAQIALTALGLPSLDDTHWTARASFVIGLVAGSLAVFCSCVLQSKMSALHNAHAVRRWLTRPRSGSKMHAIARRVTILDHFRNSDTTNLAYMKEMLSRFNEAFNEGAYRPSLSAALILTAPSQLPSIALGSLLTGFGIYFGFVYSAGLPAIEDHHSALAVLVVYIASVASGLLLFFLPVLVKLVAASRDREMGDSFDELINKWEIAIQVAQQADAVSKQDGVLSALNRILDVQEKQLQLQENFKAVLEARFQTPSL